MAMTKSLDDPLFAGRVAAVKRDMQYAVRYGDAQTRWYKVSVFDYPELKQADANLKVSRIHRRPGKTHRRHAQHHRRRGHAGHALVPSQ